MSLTAAQQRAVAARGNVLVMAGAGTGKTSTLVARCIDCLSGEDRASLDQLLVVTFTEAAAAEARERIRAALEEQLETTGAETWAHQLALFDAAHIGTLHSFCFQLVRQHFYQLGLDPQVSVLDEGQAVMAAEEVLDELLNEHYASNAAEAVAVQRLIETYGGGRDDSIRQLVQRLHAYSQTRADAAEWRARQVELFSSPEPTQWREWLLAGMARWRTAWLADLAELTSSNPKAKECADLLASLPSEFTRAQADAVLKQLVAAKASPWPPRRKTELLKPLEELFDAAEFLAALAPTSRGDPLAEDRNWSREPMLALLRLTQQFGERFQERKRAEGVMDFHDLEQFALELLWDRENRQPTDLARRWRDKFHFVFVDEYQDINAAQDRILTALSRDGAEANRFLVGDVKQSIYRFRLADPGIFRRYAKDWQREAGQTISLAENFRSRATILEFVNAVFTPLMHADIGGVDYDEAARLIPGGGRTTTPSPDTVEILVRLTERSPEPESGANALDDLQSAEKEARHVALHLRALVASGFQITDRETRQPRAVEWRDMAVLLRAPSTKAELYAKQFERLGVPLEVVRGGFFESLEVTDLLNLLRLLDNPLQDVPLLAVLRSPLVALSLDDLATIRLATRGHFWTALVRWAGTSESAVNAAQLASKVSQFLTRFHAWRQLARHASLSTCLEEILAATHYDQWLSAQERGDQRKGNVQRLLDLAGQFDQFQRQGLFRFLRFVEAQQAAGTEPESSATTATNAVRLMSVHQSKGLEFPVVVVADLGKRFNDRDLNADIVLDEEYGLCPRVRPPDGGAHYPSLIHWLARQRQERELLGEELRLLYVAMTRAREKLILTGSIARTKWEALPTRWPKLSPRAVGSVRSCAEWLRLWQAQGGETAAKLFTLHEMNDAALPEADARDPQSTATRAALPELEDATLEKLRQRLAWNYSFLPGTTRAAKTSVTALRRSAAEETESEAEPVFRPRGERPARLQPAGKLNASEIGIAHHKFQQHVRLEHAGSTTGLKAEAERLLAEHRLSADEAAAIDFAALEKFWGSEIGARIRKQAAQVRRELPFTARFAPAELDSLLGRTAATGAEDFVVVQGIVDLAVLCPEEIWLLDFKTDALTPNEVAARTGFYAPQLQLYALALARIFQRPVTQAWLHFFATGQTVPVTSATTSRESMRRAD